MRVSIIGLGLVGGSLGLALSRAKTDWEIVGHSRRKETMLRARELGAVGIAVGTLEEAVSDADLVVLATPVMAMRAIMAQMAPHLKRGCTVTDTASTKGQVLAWARALIPPTTHFVGGHPMAGKETSGIAAAEADLFAGCIYVLSPAPQTSVKALDLVIEVVKAVGAIPHTLDSEVHDELVAAISHLPFILSTALVNTVAMSANWPEMASLAASGFRDVSRLAAGDPAMYSGICQTNRQQILRCLDDYVRHIDEIRSSIATGDPGLEGIFMRAKEIRDGWWKGRAALKQSL